MGPESECLACKADAMLDQSYELAGLGIESETSDEEPDQDAAEEEHNAADEEDDNTMP